MDTTQALRKELESLALLFPLDKDGKPDIANLHGNILALKKAAQAAYDTDGGTAYVHDDDEIGCHACCDVLSYRPHADDCWVVLLGKALGHLAPNGQPIQFANLLKN